MIKVAMVEIDRAIVDSGLCSRMILQVHDELVFDVIPAELDKMQEIVLTMPIINEHNEVGDVLPALGAVAVRNL